MLLEHVRKETRKRVARGSSTRDLFYYLVRASSRGLCIGSVAISWSANDRTTKTFPGSNPLPSAISSMTAFSR